MLKLIGRKWWPGLFIKCLLLLAATSAGSAPLPPDLFFYPPPYRLSDGSIVFSPVAVEPSQVAEAFPKIKEMSGIAVILYWSQLCPREGYCDFSTIDHILNYWQTEQKKVILGIATVGPPMLFIRNGERTTDTASPNWLLRRTATYEQEATVIAPVRPVAPARRISATFPSYWDPNFHAAVQSLVTELSRYDGHPALAEVRISTGIMGEDNPSFAGLKSAMPGYSNRAWINYCRDMTDVFGRAFKRSRLEFDIDRLGYISALGTATERAAADEFVGYLNSRNVFLAMDGLDSVNVADWRSQRATGPAHSLNYIAARKELRSDVGLEGAPLFNPRWQDIPYLVSAIKDLNADRLVLFGDVPGLLNFARYGENSLNETLLAAISPKRRPYLISRAQELMDLLGFTGP